LTQEADERFLSNSVQIILEVRTETYLSYSAKCYLKKMYPGKNPNIARCTLASWPIRCQHFSLQYDKI